MKRRHSKKTYFKELVKNFTDTEIELANIIMDRVGSIEMRRALANDVKSVYLYAARECIKYLEKHILY